MLSLIYRINLDQFKCVLCASQFAICYATTRTLTEGTRASKYKTRAQRARNVATR